MMPLTPFSSGYILYLNKVSQKRSKKTEKWLNPDTDALWRAVLELKTLDEARRFFRDLLTEQEILEFANRWKVARLLDKKVSYLEIGRQTRMSSTTIARVSKWLNKGMDGYRLILNGISHHGHASPVRKGVV